MVKFSLYSLFLVHFLEGVGAVFRALSEDPRASFPGASGKTHHLSYWPEWCHVLISGPVTMAMGGDYDHWLGPESQVWELVSQLYRLCKEVWEQKEN